MVVPSDGRSDCGSVLMNARRRADELRGEASFLSCVRQCRYLYVVPANAVVKHRRDASFRLERELLPQWLQQGRHIKGFVSAGKCIDIGTPERYSSAQDILANVEVEASTTVNARVNYESNDYRGRRLHWRISGETLSGSRFIRARTGYHRTDELGRWYRSNTATFVMQHGCRT